MFKQRKQNNSKKKNYLKKLRSLCYIALTFWNHKQRGITLAS